jgi:hypothetical protein
MSQSRRAAAITAGWRDGYGEAFPAVDRRDSWPDQAVLESFLMTVIKGTESRRETASANRAQTLSFPEEARARGESKITAATFFRPLA